MTLKLVAAVLALSIAGLPLAGCEREGPGERAGKKMDRAVDKTKDALDPKGPGEKAGEKVDDALGND
jgi:hypothetical protein